MPINDDQFETAATRGDIAGVAIAASRAVLEISKVLRAIANERPISEETVAEIEKLSDDLEEHFDRLTGWNDEPS